MINIIKTYLSNIYSEKLYFILNKIKNSLIPQLMIMENELPINEDDDNKKLVKELISIYIQGFLHNEENTNIIEKISIYINKTISYNYHNNDFNQRINNEENLQSYLENLNNYCNLTMAELKKDDFIFEINEKIKDKNIIEEINNLMIFDYYNYFII